MNIGIPLIIKKAIKPLLYLACGMLKQFSMTDNVRYKLSFSLFRPEISFITSITTSTMRAVVSFWPEFRCFA